MPDAVSAMVTGAERICAGIRHGPLMGWLSALPWSRVLVNFGCFCVAFMVVLLPWVVRNYGIFHAFIPGSSLSGTTLYQGHFALDQPDYMRYRTSDLSAQALTRVLEARCGLRPGATALGDYARAIGMHAYALDQFAGREAIKLIRAYPGRYVLLSLGRLTRFWLGSRFVNIFSGGGSRLGYVIALLNGGLLGLAVERLASRCHTALYSLTKQKAVGC